MKVIKSAPTEEVKVTNLLGDEYIPEEEEFEFICDDCLADEVDTLQEAVIGLSEDIIDHEDALNILGEKIQTVEDNQVTDIENLSKTIEILGCLQKASRTILDIVMKQEEEIVEFKSKHNSLANLLCVVLAWLAVLTVLFGIYVF